MSKKLTLKHAVDGREFTRQTARCYTHVMVARHNIEKQLRRNEVEFANSGKTFERDRREEWEHSLAVLAAGLGGKVFYTRYQGGRYLNPTGPQYEVKDYMVKSAQEMIEKFGTLENYLAVRTCERARAHAEERTRIQAGSTSWFVYSWHSNAALALKSANAELDWLDTRVEAINGGVQS